MLKKVIFHKEGLKLYNYKSILLLQNNEMSY